MTSQKTIPPQWDVVPLMRLKCASNVPQMRLKCALRKDHILTTFWPHYDHILTTFWPHFCQIFMPEKKTTFWPHYDHILTTFSWAPNETEMSPKWAWKIKWPHFDHINVVKMWSFYQMITFFMSPKWAGNEPQNIPLGYNIARHFWCQICAITFFVKFVKKTIPFWTLYFLQPLGTFYFGYVLLSGPLEALQSLHFPRYYTHLDTTLIF